MSIHETEADGSNLQLWDLKSGTCLLTMQGHQGRITAVAISPDGRHGFSGSADRSLRVWDLETGACLRTLKGHTDTITSLSITSDGSRLISGSADGSTREWDLETGSCLNMTEGNPPVTDQTIAVSPDGRFSLKVANGYQS